MAWSWSHSAEAYDNARNNLELLPITTLNIIFAEWRAAQAKHGIIEDHNAFDQRKYSRALKHAEELTTQYGEGFAREQLVEFIWEKAEQAATCDNGGFDAWMCPSGCGCHCVSFSSPDEETEDEE